MDFTTTTYKKGNALLFFLIIQGKTNATVAKSNCGTGYFPYVIFLHSYSLE